MKILKRFFLSLVVLSLLAGTACSSDDDSVSSQPDCTELTTQATVNNDSDYTLSSAVFQSFSGSFTFVIQAVKNDCSNSAQFSLSYESSTVDGTYPIVDFFDADDNEASGTYTFLNITGGGSGFQGEFASGTAVVVDNGNNNYTITIQALLENGDSVSIATTHTFQTS